MRKKSCIDRHTEKRANDTYIKACSCEVKAFTKECVIDRNKGAATVCQEKKCCSHSKTILVQVFTMMTIDLNIYIM